MIVFTLRPVVCDPTSSPARKSGAHTRLTASVSVAEMPVAAVHTATTFAEDFANHGVQRENTCYPWGKSRSIDQSDVVVIPHVCSASRPAHYFFIILFITFMRW